MSHQSLTSAEHLLDSFHEPLKEQLPTGIIEATHSSGVHIQEIAGFASRYNNKRHVLIASKLLGKYIPAKPSIVANAQQTLASFFHANDRKTLFLGFAESCSGFGEGVFKEVLKKSPFLKDKAAYIHTTRQFDIKTHSVSVAFKEEHSHAVNQVVLTPKDNDVRDVFFSADTVVLIEDEITTGKTMHNFLNEYLAKVNPNLKRVTILTLLDIRNVSRKVELAASFPHIQFMTHAMCASSLNFYKEKDNDIFKPRNEYSATPLTISENTGRMGIKYNESDLSQDLESLRLQGLDLSSPITVIGTSEFTNKAKEFGVYIEKMGVDVEMLSTTRAPLKVGNAIKTKMTFSDHYGDGIEHYLYNYDTSRTPVFFYENEEQAHLHSDLHAALGAFYIAENM